MVMVVVVVDEGRERRSCSIDVPITAFPITGPEFQRRTPSRSKIDSFSPMVVGVRIGWGCCGDEDDDDEGEEEAGGENT